MDGSMREVVNAEDQTSFGIKKIVDCKVGSNGQQLYKVKWESTWEPAENLASCQHLIDEFWSFVNKAKINEEVALQNRKRKLLYPGVNMDGSINRMSEDDKADVQRLIARTNGTPIGNHILSPPRNMLVPSQQNQQKINFGMANVPSQLNSVNFSNTMEGHQNCNSPTQKEKLNATPKSESGGLSNVTLPFSSHGKEKVSSSNASSLKYVENFDNPYVKIILVCKICNKEQSLKFSSNWKRHYLSHVTSEEKKKHLKTQKNVVNQGVIKDELVPLY